MSAQNSTAQVVRPPVETLDVEAIRRDFPVLSREVHGNPLVYLDNAATSQKPRPVIETMRRFQEEDYANVHRGVHYLSQVASEAYEGVRDRIKTFLNAASREEILFVRGTTEAINLVASTYGRTHVERGDEILITGMEHHSNIVPWQMLCEEKGAHLRVVPINDRGELLMEEFPRMLNENTRLVAVTHLSNALGTRNPIREIVRAAHEWGVPVLVDGAQSVAHLRVDVQDLDCDFFAFSGHKLYGPNGIGVLYGKKKFLEEMPPYQGGGDMISSVTFERTTYADLPYKFEAGTPNITGVVGLGAAIEYVEGIGIENIRRYEDVLLEYGTRVLQEVPGLRLIGTAEEKSSVLSFVLDCAHPHDIGTILDQEGLAIRTGHHCAQPVMERMGVPATARASLAFYNTEAELDRLVQALHKVIEVFR